jgi:hypothetical protein
MKPLVVFPRTTIERFGISIHETERLAFKIFVHVRTKNDGSPFSMSDKIDTLSIFLNVSCLVDFKTGWLAQRALDVRTSCRKIAADNDDSIRLGPNANVAD